MSQPTATELGLSAEALGKAGRRLEVLSLATPELGGQCEFIEGEAEQAVATLVDKLRRDAKVL